MNLGVRPERQDHPRDVAFAQPLGVGDYQLCPVLCQIQGRSDQVSVAFVNSAPARNEGAFLQRMRVADEITIDLATVQIEAAVGIHHQSASNTRTCFVERPLKIGKAGEAVTLR